MVQTDRGVCTAVAAYPKQVFNLVGTLSLDGDRQIVADVVEVGDGAKVLTNGRSLSIVADELRLGGSAEILAFDKTQKARQAGDAGMSGGALLLAVGDVLGGHTLRIDLSGQDGVQGATGAQGAQGAAGRNARGRGLQGIRGCGGGHDSTPGAQGGQGGPGGAGGPGGNGGTVVVQVRERQSFARLNIVSKDGATTPGKGGAAGARGPGGPGGQGGAGDGGHDGCGGRGGSPNGPQGAEGPLGNPGADGKPGSITLQAAQS